MMSPMEITENDPNAKEKRQSPLNQALKIAGIVLLCTGLILAVNVQMRVLSDDVSATANVNSNGMDDDGLVALPPDSGDEEPEELPKLRTTESAQSAKTQQQAALDVEVVKPIENVRSSNPDLLFNKSRPVLVLSLPHNIDLTVARLFKCAGVIPEDTRKYWSIPKRSSLPLGLCLQNNLKKGVPMTQKCGEDMAVLSELQYMEAPRTKGKTTHGARCFDPVLYPGALEKLYQAVPDAYILTVTQDEMDWYHHLSKDLKNHWKQWCNPTHNYAFPNHTHVTDSFIKFYRDYYATLDNFMTQHPSWTNVRVRLGQDPHTIGSLLQQQLNIPEKCWTKSIHQPLRKVGVHEDTHKRLHPQRRPDTIDFPIVSLSLPLLGTAHKYFECGLGGWTVANQWTIPSKSTVEKPMDSITIGQCLQTNYNHNVTNLFKGCGHARVWSDIGYLRDQRGTCFYPSMQPDVLERLVKYYPRATLLNSVYETPTAWYNSVSGRHNLPNRWAKAQHCPGFPPQGSSQKAWEIFYEQHTQSMRDFAAKHPNVTFLEIPYSQHGGEMLQDVFQFPEHCWPEVQTMD